MSKKLLAALIAFSMVGAFGCTEPEDDNNGGNGCTQGARQCKGTVQQMCIAGSWTDGADCGAVGCNVATGMCNTNGGNNNPGGNNNNPGGNNNNPGGNNNNPGGDTTVGATCDPATYAGACSSDGSKRYYCDNTSSVIVEKPCNSGTVCEIQGVNSTKCVADPNCSATETKETSCSDGKDNDCDGWIDSNDHDCTGGGGNGNGSADLPAEVPTSCVKDTSPAVCSNDKKVAYFCGDEGTYYKGRDCPAGDCIVCENGFGGCGITCNSGGGNGNGNSGNNGEACTKETFTPSCKDDLSEGYFCGSQGTVVTKKCSNNDCYNNNGYIDCGTAPESCTGANNTGTCINDNANADVCVNGIIKHYTCYNSICRVNGDGTVYCPKDEAAAKECTGNNVSENGEVGQCCTPGSYKNSGCREDNTGTRCDSGGRVAVWTCEANETCQYDEASKWYSCK